MLTLPGTWERTRVYNNRNQRSLSFQIGKSRKAGCHFICCLLFIFKWQEIITAVENNSSLKLHLACTHVLIRWQFKIKFKRPTNQILKIRRHYLKIQSLNFSWNAENLVPLDHYSCSSWLERSNACSPVHHGLRYSLLLFDTRDEYWLYFITTLDHHCTIIS